MKMARVCYALHADYPEWIVETVEVPVGMTLKVGDVVLAETLIANSKKIYEAELVADAAVDDILIIPDQKFVELADGRRVEGADLLNDLEFKAGDKITAIRLMKHMKYELSVDSLDNIGVVVPAVDVLLIPVAGEQKLATAAVAGLSKTALKIEAVGSIPTGGKMALGYSGSVIARVVMA